MELPHSGARPGFWKAILLSLPMFALAFVMAAGGKKPAPGADSLVFAALWLFYCASFFLMIYTGKTDKWRAPIFIALAVAFCFSFITHMFAARGSMSINEAEMLAGRTPFCHMVIPMTLIPIAFTKTVIFPGSMTGIYASVASMLALWVIFSLALGRGWCAWGCFFGGLEDGFSRIFKKPKILQSVNPRLTLLPFAVLLAVALFSAAFMYPVYCAWLCPFKTVTEYAQVTSFTTLVQAFIFVGLFLSLVVMLPMLSKRRTQCGLFCPFGAFQSLTNKINPFETAIDPALCVKCGHCIKICPVFALDEDSLASGRAKLTCIKCGKCIDECPKGALFYRIKGASAKKMETFRLLFLYPAFLFLTAFSAGMIRDAAMKLIKLAATGSLL